MFTKLRPQVLVGILCLTTITIVIALAAPDYSWSGEGILGCIIGISTMLPKLMDPDRD